MRSNNLKALFVTAALAAATSPAVTFAAGDDIDVSAIVAKLVAGVVAVTAVCTAGLSVAIVVKLFKYVRTAM